MSVNGGERDANNCFVCGPGNSIGLKIVFRMDGGVCRGEFTPGRDHVGFPGVTHGGILFCALDDVMGNWLYLQGIWGYTARCEIRYRGPLPPETPLRLEGRLLKKKGRLAVLAGKAIRDDTGAVVAESQASFMIEDMNWQDKLAADETVLIDGVVGCCGPQPP